MQQKNESTMICGINPPIRTNVSVACFCLGAFSFWSYVHQSVDGWGANVNHHLLAKVATRECFTALRKRASVDAFQLSNTIAK